MKILITFALSKKRTLNEDYTYLRMYHKIMEIKEINNRYSELAESECCLSCGGAINYAEPITGEVCVDLGSGRGTDV